MPPRAATSAGGAAAPARRRRRIPKYAVKSDLIQPILDAELSPVSKRVYLTRLRTILSETGKSIFAVATNPTEHLAWVRGWSEAPATQKSYIAAILAVFRHNEGLKDQQQQAYQEWYAAFQEINGAIDERYKNNEPSARQKEGYVPYAEIVAKRDALPDGSDDRLLLSLYTYLPPLRCDFNRLRIYDAEPVAASAPAAKDAAAAAPAELNYIVLPRRAAGGANVALLVLGEFKTRAHHDEPLRKELPEPLTEQLRLSVHARDRDWVFTDRSGGPYSAMSYTKWANRALARLFGRPLTVSLIRHSFINTLDMNTLTVAEKEKIAHDMAHTVAMQDRYRLIFRPADRPKTPTPADPKRSKSPREA